MKRIVVVGGGFAGLWSAVAAVRRLEELSETAQVILINATEFHDIRVRNYEMDLSDTRIALRDVLDPIGVDLITGHVLSIDTRGRQLRIDEGGEIALVEYDKLILASGSKLAWPDVPGLREHARSPVKDR